jgi:soluble lytic murein transglycosylase-like protein
MSIDSAWSRIQSIEGMLGQVQKLQDTLVAGAAQSSQAAAPGFQAQLAQVQNSQAVQPGTTSGAVTGNTKHGSPAPAWVENLISEASAKYKVDRNLIRAVMRAESDFNPGSGSGAGAVGLMQVMPQYAKEQSGYTADQVRTNNRANVFAGVAELAGDLKRYNGNIPLSLAAYNAGPGAVAKYGGIPPYGETQAYVKKICGELGISPKP